MEFSFWKDFNTGYLVILDVINQEIAHFIDYESFVSHSTIFFAVAWSPNSQWLAVESHFEGRLGGSEKLYVMNAVSGQIIMVADAPYHAINCPTWLSQENKLLFSRWSSIYIAEIGQDEVIAYSILEEGYPACQWWLPDSNQILFNTYDDQIYLLDVENGSLLKLVEGNISGYNGGSPKLSPAGSHVLYYSDPHLYVMEIDGSNVINLTEGFTPTAITPERVYWSPDNDHIALEYDEDIYLVNVAERNLVNLTPSLEGDAIYAGWSPDGSQIAFTSLDAIYAVDVEASLPVRLTEAGLTAENPVWSPDGTFLAFIGQDALYVMNENGTESRRLAYLESNTDSFAWSPDEKTIAINHGNGKIGLYGLDGTVFTFFAVK
ncbi:MAG: DPP IV N-terminal domain-containing protein [Anaerolineae bacterium]|nr:DPP IV N-terminal domain-containing protein [Anaerolineae bacterium]